MDYNGRTKKSYTYRTKQARVNKMLTGLKLRQIQDNELFISGMDGKEARNGIIDVCRKSMEDEY